MRVKPGNMTRQQQKALDKEVPWQHIMELPTDVLQKYIKANQEEKWPGNQ